jgi:hypothetical protein
VPGTCLGTASLFDRERLQSGVSQLFRTGTTGAQGALQRIDTCRGERAKGTVMFISQKLMKIVRSIAASMLIGCAAGAASPSELEKYEVDTEEAGEGEDEVGVSMQALGGFTQHLPKRGSDKRLVDTEFLGWGMLYAMELRTGALVDAITTSFYTPSNASNRFSPGDPVFTRGPVGGTAGSKAPLLTCPGGYAASGIYGRSGAHVDMLGLVCAEAGSDGRPIKSTERAIGAYGGQGGTFFYDVCPEGQWLGGIMAEVAAKSSGTNNIIGSVQGWCASAS